MGFCWSALVFDGHFLPVVVIGILFLDCWFRFVFKWREAVGLAITGGHDIKANIRDCCSTRLRKISVSCHCILSDIVGLWGSMGLI